MPSRIFRDRIIAYKKGNKYLAVSLEFDLLAEGDSLLQSFKRLHDATSGYLKMCCEEKEPDSEIYRKAEKKYQDLYELFVELSEKKSRKETEKKKGKELSEKGIFSSQLTYNTKELCNA